MPARKSFLASMAMLASSLSLHAATSDFLFGEDFDTSIACPAGPTPAIAGVMSPGLRTTRLGTNNTFLAKVRSCGYAGNVNFLPTGAPMSWSLSADPPSVSLAAGGYAVALVSANIPTYGDSGYVTIDLSEQASSNTVPLSGAVDAANEILIVIRDGTGSDQSLHPFVQGMTVRVGTKVRIYSDDSTDGHIIHASGIAGFVHMNTGGSGLLQGQEYDQTPTAAGTGELYCHNHGPIRSFIAK